jgi:8-amino-7-oxononanoate synthase
MVSIIMPKKLNINIAKICTKNPRSLVKLMDELYHASGIFATNLSYINVEFFRHNDANHLEELLKKYKDKKRKIVAVEGIYSMDGDMVKKEIFELCDKEDAILIVDEAHSCGVVGENLMGVFDFYNITPKPNHIKMGTLGKAYGSFGAYILASSHIISYLENRAKPLIYATALSLYDTLLAHNSLKYIIKNTTFLKNEILKRKIITKEVLNIDMDGLIVPILIGDNKKVMNIKEALKNMGYFIGAIREPTVKKAILRVIPKIDIDENIYKKLLFEIKELI